MCQIAKMKIHRRCKTPEESISVVIQWKDEQVVLCKSCWERIPNDLEWGTDPKPILEEIFGRRAKEEAKATPTEYKLKGEKVEQEKQEDDEF
jgi:hypothetical protein